MYPSSLFLSPFYLRTFLGKIWLGFGLALALALAEENGKRKRQRIRTRQSPRPCLRIRYVFLPQEQVLGEEDSKAAWAGYSREGGGGLRVVSVEYQKSFHGTVRYFLTVQQYITSPGPPPTVHRCCALLYDAVNPIGQFPTLKAGCGGG